MLGIITTVVRGAAKALLATTKNPTTGKTIKKVFKDPRAAKKWLQDQGATEIKTGAPKGVSARGGQTREAQFPETLTRRKGGKKVGSVPTPRRKPKKPNPKSKSSIDKYLTSPRRVGIGPSEMLGRPPIKEDKVPIIRSPTKPHVGRPKGWKPSPPNTRRDKALQRFLDDLLKSKNKGGKVMKKKGGKVIYKRQGGMSRVGLSPAEEARSGTMSEAKREKYMQGGGPIHTTFPKRAHPRTEGRAPEVDLFPEVGRKKGSKVGKKKQGYKDRKDESIAQRVKKKRTKKQLKASRDESYGKWGKGKGKGKIRRITSKQTDGNKLVASLYD
jgi:hypothetical protein